MFAFKTLGTPELTIDGNPVRLHRKILALLSFLCIESNRPHSRSYLAELFWPDLPEIRANNSLRQALHILRKTFESQSSTPVIHSTIGQVRLTPEFIHAVDAASFLYPPQGCPILHDPSECGLCKSQLLGALKKIRGPFLENLSLSKCEGFEQWVTGKREELAARSRWALDGSLALLEKEKQFKEKITLLERFLSLDPYDEECHRLLMTLLLKIGNRKGAERQYSLCLKLLNEELDVDPEPETRALFEQIRDEPAVSPPVVLPEPEKAASPHLFEWRQATALYLDIHSIGAFDAPFSSSPLWRTLLEVLQDLGVTKWRIDEHGLLVWFGIDGELERATIQATKVAFEIGNILSHGPKDTSGRFIYRAGIHSGRVLKHYQKNTTDPTGMVSRSAMSLCLQAQPGTLLLSSEAFRALRGLFSHGGTEPVTLLRRRTQGYTFPLQAPKESLSAAPLLIGRQKESQIFKDLYSPGHGGFLLVEGEPGIGKTALVRSFLREAKSRGALIRVFECFPHTSNIPFYPFVQWIREYAKLPLGVESDLAQNRLSEYLRSLDLEKDPHAHKLLQSLLSISTPRPENLSEINISSLGKKMFAFLKEIMTARARMNPVVLLTEDLQWIDPSTGTLLKDIVNDPFLAKNTFFIATARSGEIPSWVESVPRGQKIHLSALATEEARAFVHAMDHTQNLSDKMISRILVLGDGVPLYLQELTRESLESSGKSKRFPSSIWEVLDSRLGRLGEESRSLISVAAVIGRKVPIDLLRPLFPALSTRLFDCLLEEAIDVNLVRRSADPSEQSGEVIVFRHALIQEAAIRSLPSPLLKDIHRKVGLAFCDHFPERIRATPGIVAFHFDHAGEISSAVDWYEKAGEHSLWEGGLIEAEHSLRRALALLSKISSDSRTETKKFRLTLLLGTVLIERDGMGYGKEIIQTLSGEDSLPDSEDPFFPEKLESRFRYWESLFGGQDLRIIRKVTDTFFNLADWKDKPTPLAYSLFTTGCVLFWEGHFPETNQTMGGCLTLFDTISGNNRPLPLEAIRLKAQQCYPWGMWFEGRFREVQEHLSKLLSEAESPHYPPFAKPFLLAFVAYTYRYFRNTDETLRVCDLLLDINKDQENKRWNPSERELRGWALSMKGDPQGVELILKSLPFSRKSHGLTEVIHLSILAEAYLALGETNKAQGVVDSALRFSKKSGTAFFDAELHRIKGLAALAKGHRTEARKLFSEALSISRHQGARALALRAATSLGQLAIEERVPKKAKGVFDGLEDLLEGPEEDLSLPDVQEAREIWKTVSGMRGS